MIGPERDRVWTAPQYVAELRRRRDEMSDSAAREDQPGPSWAVFRARAEVYEECAALAELTADQRARGPVLDALAALHSKARDLSALVHRPGGDVECVAGLSLAEQIVALSDAVDAALDARRAAVIAPRESHVSPSTLQDWYDEEHGEGKYAHEGYGDAAVADEPVRAEDGHKPLWCQHPMSEIGGSPEFRRVRREGWERCPRETRFCPPVHRRRGCR